MTFPGDDHPLGPAPWTPTPDGRGLWSGSYDGGDRMRLARLDLTTGAQTVLDSHPTHDLDTQSQVAPLKPSALITDRRTGGLLGVRYSRERQVIHPLTEEFARVLAPSSWLYDHVTGVARPLFRPLGRLDPDALAPMVPVSITARDGLELPSYLTLPVGHDAEEHAPPPLIVMPPHRRHQLDPDDHGSGHSDQVDHPRGRQQHRGDGGELQLVDLAEAHGPAVDVAPPGAGTRRGRTAGIGHATTISR